MATSDDEVKCDVESARAVQALFNAVSSSKLRLVRLLVDGGIHVESRNSQSQTPLLATCSSLEKSHFRGETREKVVKYLIAAGANVNAQDKTGRTPLIYAVITQAHESVIFDLVEAGANLWKEDHSKNCAFDYALQRQDVSQVGAIVEAYKRYNSRRPEDVDEPTTSKVFAETLNNPRSPPATPQKKSLDNKKKFLQKSLQKRRHDSNSTSPKSGTEHSSIGTPSDERTRIPTCPVRPTMHRQPSEEKQLCSLCRSTILENTIPGTEKWSNTQHQSVDLPDLNLSAYDLSGLLYRRRSTGSLFGLTEERYEAIRKKRNLGITMEDLFSSTEINRPATDGQPLLVKSPRTNTMVDISAKGLSAPDISRARSLSVCLPLANDAGRGVRYLGEQEFSLPGNEKPLLLGYDLFPRPFEAAASCREFSPSAACFENKDDSVCVTSDSDGEWDDILVVPSSQIREGEAMTSHQDVTSSEDKPLWTPGGTSESAESNSRSSPIPRIVLTNVTNPSPQSQKENAGRSI